MAFKSLAHSNCYSLTGSSTIFRNGIGFGKLHYSRRSINEVLVQFKGLEIHLPNIRHARGYSKDPTFELKDRYYAYIGLVASETRSLLLSEGNLPHHKRIRKSSLAFQIEDSHVIPGCSNPAYGHALAYPIQSRTPLSTQTRVLKWTCQQATQEW